MSLSANSYRLSRILYHLKTVKKKDFSIYARVNIDSSYLATYGKRILVPTIGCRHLHVLNSSKTIGHIYSTLFIGKRHHSKKINNKFTLRNDTYREYLNHLEQEWRDMDEQRSMGATLGREKVRKLVVLNSVVEIFEKLKVKYDELEELSQMLNDEEMKDDAETEKQNCLTEIDDLEENLVDIVCPEETIDECDIILEIESGAGGQEAMLFAEEIFQMYENYSLYKGWQFSPTQISKAEAGNGYRKAAAIISGQGVYGIVKYEGGVHRVQRIPKTESKGRIHTSTISVAIYPQPSEIDVVLHPKDLQIETFRSSGPGGQNANVTDSAVRIKHAPTGITAEIQTTRSQAKNRELALTVVRTRIYEMQLAQQRKQITSQRKMQVGNKDRSEKIRTYNFLQDRITDHRLGYNVHNISTFLNGGDRLDNMVQELLEEANKENLLSLLEEFEKTRVKDKVRK